MVRKQWMVAGIFFIVFYLGIQHIAGVSTYIEQVKQSRTEPEAGEAFYSIRGTEPLSGKDRLLMDRIEEEAKKLNVPPDNAKVDRVWKAIPGYNGLIVDTEKTFRLAKQSGIGSDGKIPFVFKEVPPEISLEQLGAQPIYKGNPNKPMVSLMINVAWGNEYIPGMLRTLEKENVHATFFLDGSWLNRHTDIAKQIARYGHEMSNHAYSHKPMSRLSRGQATQEIVKTQTLLKERLGVDNSLFAPPSGDFDMETVQIAHELKLKTILWTIDTVDWKKPEPQWILRKISSRLEPGALILMHPTSSSSRALEGIIKEVKRRGFALGTVSELLSPRRVAKTHFTGADSAQTRVEAPTDF